jgi:DNA invertase Pin-like site-specific DNA recombinase
MTNHNRPGWALYLRVSDEDRQSPERSFALQRDEIRRVLLRDSELPVVAEYEDRLTGTNYDRAQFQQMLTEAEAGRFDHLALYRVDRFGRDTAEGLTVAKRLRDWGVHVVPASNPSLDIATPDGWMLFTILLGLGEHEVGVLRLRTTGGMRAKLEQGIWCWRAPDGYRNVSREVNSGKTESWVEIDPERAPIIRRAWELLLTGEYSYRDICRILHDAGHTRRNGRPWIWQSGGKEKYAHATLSKIFHNPFYAGWIVSEGFDIVWGEIRSQAGALVSSEEWSLAQEILEGRNRRKLNTQHPYLLQALAVLHVDDRAIPMQCATIRKDSGDYPYYVVPKSQMGSAGDRGIYLPTDDVEESLEALLASIAVDPAHLPALREQYRQDVKDAVAASLDEQIHALRRRIGDLHEQEKQYARLYAKGSLSMDAFEELAAETRSDMARAQGQLSRIERGSEDRIRDLDHAAQLISRIPEAWPYLAYRERRQLLRLLFREVHVDPAGEVLGSSVLCAPFAYLRVTSVTLSGVTEGVGVTPVTEKGADESAPGSGRVLFGAPALDQPELKDILKATAIERPELLYRVKFP